MVFLTNLAALELWRDELLPLYSRKGQHIGEQALSSVGCVLLEEQHHHLTLCLGDEGESGSEVPPA